jgi:protein gp37
MVLKTIHENARTPAVFLDTTQENAGTPAALDDMTHGDVTLANTNSVDKVVDKDPKHQYEDTVKRREEELVQIAANINECIDTSFEMVVITIANLY